MPGIAGSKPQIYCCVDHGKPPTPGYPFGSGNITNRAVIIAENL